ncbi:MAG TPA: GGDEF domain-containing protein, partial [Proteiniclasticum sp.]|nr:GGDEF domain-containing protein [Proteiniclasticum sp.]
MSEKKNIIKKANEMIIKPRDVGFLTKVSMYLVTVFLCLGLIILSQGIKQHFVRELEVNARNLSKGYSLSLSKSVEASSVVEQLIHDKLLGISNIITNYKDDLVNEDLTDLAKQMDVGEIHIYDTLSTLTLSNIEEFIGYVPPLNHPVWSFSSSDMNYYIEPIRPNLITGEFYLYGYEKMTDGRVVQVGINALKVEKLISGFHLNNMLIDMMTHKEVAYVNYISSDGIILGSSNGKDIGTVLETKEVETLSKALNIGEFRLVPKEKYHVFYEPVYLAGTEAGMLLIGLTLDGTRESIKNMNRFVTFVFLMIYLAAIMMIYLLHDKNRKLFSLAYEDDITKLPNAKYLRRMLAYELKQSPRDRLALIMIHVPKFNKITMARGYEQGDTILQDIARNISAQDIEGARLFRYSEEKFMLLIRNYEKKETLVQIMENMSQVIPLQEERAAEKRYNTLAFGALEIGEKHKGEVDALKDVLIALNNVNEDASKSYLFF